jgi:hypothetical protein
MSHSIYNADRGTHLKIVVVGLLFAVVVVAVAKFARVSDLDLGTEPLVRAGRATVVTGHLPAVQ